MEHDKLEEAWPDDNYSYLVQALQELAESISRHELTTLEAAAEVNSLADWALALHRSLMSTNGAPSSTMPTASVPRETQLALQGSGPAVRDDVDERRPEGESASVAPGEAGPDRKRLNRALLQIREKRSEKTQAKARFRRSRVRRGRFRGKLRRRAN